MKITKKEVQKKAKKFWAIAWPFICRTWVNIIWPFVIQWGIKRWILPACLMLVVGGSVMKGFKFTSSATAPAGGYIMGNGAIANVYDAQGKPSAAVHIPLGASPKYEIKDGGLKVSVKKVNLCFVLKGGADYVMSRGLTPGLSTRLVYFGKRAGFEAGGNIYGPKVGLDWQSPLFRQNMTAAVGICPRISGGIEWWRLYGGVSVAF